MKKLLFAFCLLLMFAGKSFAAGGTCPTGANYNGTTPFSGVPGGSAGVTLSSLGITNCFYVSAAGSDSNNGTSEATPWAHLPGMAGCTATCASTTPAAGEGFIMRGGDTYGAANFGGSGIQWNWSGTSSNPIYIGVDKTWFTGGSWNRPIFNAQQQAFAQFFYLHSSWIYVDNIEFTGTFWTGTATVSTGTNGVVVCGLNDTLENAYEHGWGWTTPWTNSNGPTNGLQPASLYTIGDGCDQASSVGVTLRYSVVDGSDTANEQIAIITGFAPVSDPVAYGNYFSWGTWGALDGCGDNWHDNVAINIGIPVNAFYNVPNPSYHQNGFKHLGACNQSSIFSYNNVVLNQVNWGGGNGMVKYWYNGAAGSYTTYAFNDVISNVVAGNVTDFGAQQHSVSNDGSIFLFNNSFECGSDTNLGICTYGNGQPTGSTMSATLYNNMWITGNTTICEVLCPSGGYSFSETTPLYFLTAAAAKAQGYFSTSAYAFQPTTASGGTVNQGTNRRALCTTISALDSFAGNSCLSDTTYGVSYNSTTHTVSYPGRTPNARPLTANWDIGAYQFQAGASNPIASPSPTTLAFGNVTDSCGVSCPTLSTTVTNAGTATLSSIAASISGSADYSITNNTCTSLAPNSTCSITVKLNPGSPGAEPVSNLVITSNAPTVNVALTGTGVAVASITTSPSTLAFGNQQTSTTSTPLTDTVTSTGGSNFVFNASPYTMGGTNPGDFSVVVPGSVTWTTVQKANNFTCTSGTVSPATLTCAASFASNVTAGHTLVALASIWNIKTAGSSISVPTHNATTGDSDTWTHCPSGAGANIFSTSNTYSVTDCDYVLSATGGSKTVTISWTPSGYTTGIIDEDLSIYELVPSAGTVSIDTQGKTTNSNCTTCTGPALTQAGNSDAVFQWSSNPANTFTSISGVGYTCDNDNSTANVYGAFCLALNQTSSPAQTWTYGGASPVALSALALTATTGTGSACVGNGTVAPNGTCTIQVTFTPTTTGSRSATLTLNGNAAGSIALTGTGQAAVTAATPTVTSGNPPGTYTSSQNVTFSSSTSGATDIYTTDGSTPGTTSGCTPSGTGTAHADPTTVTVSSTETLLFIACKSGDTNSGTGGGVYTITTTPTLSNPTFSVAAGTALSFQPITITTASGGTSHYTVDGTTPTCSSTAYTTPITITQNTLLQAIACGAGFNNSGITSAQYNVIVSTPTFTPNSSFGPNGTTVTITVANPGAANLCVTLNGTTPAGNGNGGCVTGQLLTNGGMVTINFPTVVQAIGTAGGYVDSQVGTAVIISPVSAPAVIFML